jgi:3-oxoacyl-[acyl-carrier protein] reductase
VTGAGSGIGRGVALALATQGIRVAALDASADGLAETVDAAAAGGGDVLPLHADVSSWEEVSAARDAVVARWGAPAILVTAAAIDAVDEITEMALEDWRRMIEVDLYGTFFALKAVTADMKAVGYGRVVLIGSNVVSEGVAGKTHYGAAKGGVHALARSAALELAPHGITVNVLAPGLVETPMTAALSAEHRARLIAGIPVGRFGAVDELVPLALLLCSPEASYMTGATFNVSGGRVLP